MWYFQRKKQTINIFYKLYIKHIIYQSVSQLSCSVMSDSLRPHELQHARPPCPSPAPGVHPNSRASNRWCHPAISSSFVPFSSCPQSLPASESFPMSQFFAWGGQSIGVSASASVLPMNAQDWSPLGYTGWISLPRDSQESSPAPQFKSINFSALSLLYGPTHIHTWLLEKNIVLSILTFVSKEMFLLFNTLSRFVIAFLPRSKHLLISWLRSACVRPEITRGHFSSPNPNANPLQQLRWS